jgi:hypothetical protein
MSNQGGSRSGRDRGSSLFSLHRNVEAPTKGLSANRLVGLIGGLEFTPAAPMMNEDAPHAEAAVAERAKAATDAADESAKSAVAVTVPAATTDEGPSTAEVDEAGTTGLGSVARMLAMATKLHDEHVAEGQDTRQRLITEGQSRHDQIIDEATARQEELLSASQAKHDALITEAEALVAEATAEHERMISEARTHYAEMLADAQQTSAEVLQGLSRERSLRQKEIDELRTFESDHRTRLKSYLKSQLNELAQTGTDDGVKVFYR